MEMKQMDKAVKDKTLAFKATEAFHTEVVTFCNDRNLNMSRFLEESTREGMNKVKKDKRIKKK